MKQVFLAYDQLVRTKINVVGLKGFFATSGKAELVFNVNKNITAKEYHVKREVIDLEKFNLLNRPFVHTFPVLSYAELEKPIVGPFWTFDIYVNEKCVLSKRKDGAMLCERKRFVERCIADYLSRYLNYQVRLFSGPNNPDIILKDPLCDSEIQCEITEKTNSDNELTYEKYSQDVEKYEKYKRERRFPHVKHLLIVPCSNGIHHSIRSHLRDFVTIITFNDLYNLLYSLKTGQDSILNKDKVKNIISNPGIQKAPRIYRKVLTPFQKARILKPCVIDLREKKSPVQVRYPLLYIRDINPFEVIKIVEIAKANKDEYLTKTRFKETLIMPHNLKHLNQRRADASEETSKSRITKEWWLITPVQLGYLDSDCKITDKGLFLLELVEKRDQETVRKSMGYDFLNAPGVRDFLRTANKIFRDPFYRRAPSKATFYQVLARRMKENGLSSCEANARKDYENLFRWLRIFGYSDVTHFLNVERIRQDYMLEEN
jgi:hypothetical protein